jgi:beta-lactamase class A
MIAYRATPYRKRPSRVRWVILAATLVAVAAAAFIFFMMNNRKPAPKESAAPAAQTTPQPPEAPPKPKLVNLQPALDKWLARQTGEFGIVVYDPDNEQVIASHDADVQFFTASIYKLYAVYLALEDVEAGKHSLSESYKFGKTREQCIHDAIHTSDSPCAEALLNEIGQAEVTARLKEYSFTGTAFPAFVTTAHDSVAILRRLHKGRDLTRSSTEIMLKAMKTQVYRDGLPKGMPEATVADKVGFSETPHYHDVGIVSLPNDRDYLVAFLSKGVGTRVVADFGALLYHELNK